MNFTWLFSLLLAINSCLSEGTESSINYLSRLDLDRSNTSDTYLNLLISNYGSDNGISSSQMQTLMLAVNANYSPNDHVVSCNVSNQTYDSAVQCLAHQCLNVVEIFQLFGISDNHATPEEFSYILPSLVFYLQQNCKNVTNRQGNGHGVSSSKPSPGHVWGIGFLCVTMINICALLGMVFIPLMSKSFYKRLLMFMVALGVGTLTGSSLLFLIPECFEMTEAGSEHYEDYIWKATTVIGGIYMFFLVERILQSIIDRKKVSFLPNKHKNHREGLSRANAGSVKLTPRTRHDSTSMNMSFHMPEIKREQEAVSEVEHEHRHTSSGHADQQRAHMHHVKSNDSHLSTQPLMHQSPSQASQLINGQNNIRDGEENHDTSIDSDEQHEIKSVAWMVVFGDGVHNFIDGLSIGAAFTNSILAGVSVSVAVICEELPHELGDFAILLNSGMSMKQALLYNFLSACMCYLGLIIGILIGELTAGSPWIFAIAGGMFLYISLVDMLPEVNHAAQEEINETGKMWPSFIIQNCGLLTGYGIMIFMAAYVARIDFEGLLS